MKPLAFVVLLTVLSHAGFVGSRITVSLSAIQQQASPVTVGVLMALYMLVIARGLYIAVQAQDTFSRLMAGALTLTFAVYVFVNSGMVAGLLPVVGVPLPLVSYGGTSMVTLMAGFGILMSIHSRRKLVST